EALREAVLAHPGLVWQPAGRSTWQGRQSPMLDLSPGSPFADFGAMVRHVVDERLAAVRADPALRGHPWTRTLPPRWRLQAWCTVLESGGRQDRKSTRLNSSHVKISYAVFCLKKK